MALARFHEAQASGGAGYPTALREMQQGRKSSHWIWYVFPQIDGMGRSSTARQYAIRDFQEACDYLRDPLLRTRYAEIAAAVAAALERGIGVETLMGGGTDALKLASSLTLFRAAAQHLSGEDEALAALASRCDALLRTVGKEGYPACAFTLARIVV